MRAADYANDRHIHDRVRIMAAKWSMLFFSLGLILPLQTAKKSVWDGAYTDTQAERGQKGDTFMDRWHDYSVKPLFNMIKTEMPPLRFRTPDTRPLSDEMYVDIITYILTSNAFPAGREELMVGTLDRVQILGRNGVQPPPQFALVLSVGCMTYKPASWVLTRATS